MPSAKDASVGISDCVNDTGSAHYASSNQSKSRFPNGSLPARSCQPPFGFISGCAQ
jgi:hypothetical protein